MKFLGTQPSYLLSDRQLRQNLSALLKYLALLAAVNLVYGIGFHIIMAYEDQEHSWLTGIYWTLTVMSTLGFGDITFHSDLGRIFSILVLLTGVVMLLIVLPFAFIRFFYAPWLEAQLNTRAPRAVPPGTTGHVVIREYDPVARDLIERLRLIQVPSFLLEPDPAKAAEHIANGVSVIAGDPESPSTWDTLRVHRIRSIFANSGDARNTNITLTVRHESPDVPIVASAESEDSIDILELAGATEVLPLKKRLGEALASRVNAGHAEAHVIGEFRDLMIAEFAVHKTPLVGRTLRDTKLRALTGASVVGVWERGRFEAARSDLPLHEFSVPVVVGTQEQLDELNSLLVIYHTNHNPTLVIGGGKVGCAAAATLRRRGIPVHIIERSQALAERLTGVADRVIACDAADGEALLGAGLAEAPAVILSTNDDSINVYLSVYCRRLNPELRIISRVTHDRNLEAIHRAGADFALSYASLGVESVVSHLQGRGLMMIGAGLELFQEEVPPNSAGRSLAEVGIGARTGLNVIAVQNDGTIVPNPPGSQLLPADGELLMIGTHDQRQEFMRLFR